MSAEGQRALYGGKADITIRPTISLIAGHSGMGKSTLLASGYDFSYFREVEVSVASTHILKNAMVQL